MLDQETLLICANRPFISGLPVREIIIQCKFFFIFIAPEPTTWPANNCLQIMVCSCTMSPNCVYWLQITFCSCVNEASFPSCDCFCLKMAGRFQSMVLFIEKQPRWSNDKTIIGLGHRKISWFVSVSQINYYLPQPSASANNWSAHDRQITIFCSTSSNNC